MKETIFMIGTGAAYIFVRDGANWTQQAYLKASNAEALDFYGRSVTVSGDTVVVAAPIESSSATVISTDATVGKPTPAVSSLIIAGASAWIE